jgi:FkbM family methyltransferase
VEDPILQVDDYQGRFALSAKSALFRRLAMHGHYERELTKRCLELLDPERDVLDVGANVGFHTVLFAKRLKRGRRLAVEPATNALRRLRRNLQMNLVQDKVIIFEGVASNAPGTVQLKVVAGKEEFSSIGALKHPAIAEDRSAVEVVIATTVDELVEKHRLTPRFMKVDVEGAEHLVFEGARHTLQVHRPAVIAELSDFLLRNNGSSALAVVRVFENLNYEVIDPLHPKIKPGHREFGDVLCLPR